MLASDWPGDLQGAMPCAVVFCLTRYRVVMVGAGAKQNRTAKALAWRGQVGPGARRRFARFAPRPTHLASEMYRRNPA